MIDVSVVGVPLRDCRGYGRDADAARSRRVRLNEVFDPGLAVAVSVHLSVVMPAVSVPIVCFVGRYAPRSIGGRRPNMSDWRPESKSLIPTRLIKTHRYFRRRPRRYASVTDRPDRRDCKTATGRGSLTCRVRAPATSGTVMTRYATNVRRRSRRRRTPASVADGGSRTHSRPGTGSERRNGRRRRRVGRRTTPTNENSAGRV